jgi:hypothetical protein
MANSSAVDRNATTNFRTERSHRHKHRHNDFKNQCGSGHQYRPGNRRDCRNIYKVIKGKYLDWGIASLLIGLVLGALTMSLINMYLGALVLTGSITGGLFYIAEKQKRGLHTKSRARGVFIFQIQLKGLKNYDHKASI